MENQIKYPWSQKWTSRNKLVSSYVVGKSVLDIGGGLGELKTFLKPDVMYTSIDLEQWTPETIVLDLNKTFPYFKQPFDTVVCQGVIEYINDPVRFLQNIKIHNCGSYLILTYRKESGAVMPRNEYRQKDIQKMLENNGWEILQLLPSVSKKERLFICKSKTN